MFQFTDHQTSEVLESASKIDFERDAITCLPNGGIFIFSYCRELGPWLMQARKRVVTRSADRATLPYFLPQLTSETSPSHFTFILCRKQDPKTFNLRSPSRHQSYESAHMFDLPFWNTK